MSFAHLEDGRVFGWSDNDYVQRSVHYFNQIDHPINEPYFIIDCNSNKIKKISCGSLHFLILFEDGRFYLWGRTGYKSMSRGK